MLCLAVGHGGIKQQSRAFGLGCRVGSVAVHGFGYANVFLLKALGQVWFYHRKTGSSDASFKV